MRDFLLQFSYQAVPVWVPLVLKTKYLQAITQNDFISFFMSIAGFFMALDMMPVFTCQSPENTNCLASSFTCRNYTLDTPNFFFGMNGLESDFLYLCRLLINQLLEETILNIHLYRSIIILGCTYKHRLLISEISSYIHNTFFCVI